MNVICHHCKRESIVAIAIEEKQSIDHQSGYALVFQPERAICCAIEILIRDLEKKLIMAYLAVVKRLVGAPGLMCEESTLGPQAFNNFMGQRAVQSPCDNDTGARRLPVRQGAAIKDLIVVHAVIVVADYPICNPVATSLRRDASGWIACGNELCYYRKPDGY